MKEYEIHTIEHVRRIRRVKAKSKADALKRFWAGKATLGAACGCKFDACDEGWEDRFLGIDETAGLRCTDNQPLVDELRKIGIKLAGDVVPGIAVVASAADMRALEQEHVLLDGPVHRARPRIEPEPPRPWDDPDDAKPAGPFRYVASFRLVRGDEKFDVYANRKYFLSWDGRRGSEPETHELLCDPDFDRPDSLADIPEYEVAYDILKARGLVLI